MPHAQPASQYPSIAAHFRHLIRTKNLTRGMPLPTAQDIAATWGTDQKTAERVLQTLEDEGLVRTSRDLGVVVAEIRPRKSSSDRVSDLLTFDDEAFRNAVHEYLVEYVPRPADHAVFRDDRLIRRTNEALTAIIGELGVEIDSWNADPATKYNARRKEALEAQAIVVAERKTIRPMIGALTDRENQASGLRQRTLEELARRHPAEFLAIRRELKAADEQAKR
jgi:DNA-binding transcriptional regulator YhcF (GntR family)